MRSGKARDQPEGERGENFFAPVAVRQMLPTF